MAHLTCVGASRDELHAILGETAAAGVDNVLALRGDPPRGETTWTPHPEGPDARQRNSWILIAADYDFCVGAACFPEVHVDAPDLARDLVHLKRKVDDGVSFLITHLFFDNELYFRFVDEARAVGIEVPILPGIMPITSTAQIKTITGLCGATIPPALMSQLELRTRERRRGARAGRLLRDAAVRRAAGAGRAGRALLHAQPLAGDARDPVGAQAAAAVGQARDRQSGALIASAWASIGCPSSS